MKRITEASLDFFRRYIPDNQNEYVSPIDERTIDLRIEKLDTTNEENELLAQIANMRFVG